MNKYDSKRKKIMKTNWHYDYSLMSSKQICTKYGWLEEKKQVKYMKMM